MIYAYTRKKGPYFPRAKRGGNLSHTYYKVQPLSFSFRLSSQIKKCKQKELFSSKSFFLQANTHHLRHFFQAASKQSRFRLTSEILTKRTPFPKKKFCRALGNVLIYSKIYAGNSEKTTIVIMVPKKVQ